MFICSIEAYFMIILYVAVSDYDIVCTLIRFVLHKDMYTLPMCSMGGYH